MTKNAKNILSLSANQAMDFFMKSDRYHSFELPEYLGFDDVLSFVRKKVGSRKYEDCVAGTDVGAVANLNFEMLLNKDGKYGVRPLTLVNPYLYYFLCRELCQDGHWDAVLDSFKAFSVPHFTATAIPVLPKEKEPFHKATTILNWWNELEQRSLELSLQYRYMFVSDITNCYGSINLDVIGWALTKKGTSLASDDNADMAKGITRFLHMMQQSRNVGIPQGSPLFDLIAEIVLGYADLLLHEAIEQEKAHGTDFGDYEILRYRDDYRVFCNDKDKLEQLSYLLQHVLERIGFRMNTQKTRITEDVVCSSVKPDKLFYIFNTPIFNKKGCDFDGFEKHFMYLLLFGRKHPNAGQLKTMLSDLDQRVVRRLKADKKKKKEDRIKENKVAIIAVATQLAVENVTVVHYALRTVSHILKAIDDEQQRRQVVRNVYERLRHQPNSTYTQLWLQNITFNDDKANGRLPYDMPLCRLVAGEDVALWNNTWLKPALTQGFPTGSVVSRTVLKKCGSEITFRETRSYNQK